MNVALKKMSSVLMTLLKEGSLPNNNSTTLLVLFFQYLLLQLSCLENLVVKNNLRYVKVI